MAGAVPEAFITNSTNSTTSHFINSVNSIFNFTNSLNTTSILSISVNSTTYVTSRMVPDMWSIFSTTLVPDSSTPASDSTAQINTWLKKTLRQPPDDFSEGRERSDEGSTAEEEGLDWREPEYGGQMAAGLALILLAIITALGNSLVIHAIRTEKRLQTVSNLFLMSLAVADLIIGVIVMPITAAYTIAGEWRWGRGVCRFWLATDYTASTASIFNLVVLTLDRYWSVMAPLRYLRRRTRRRASLLIAGSWAAACLWLLPVLAWKHINPGYSASASLSESPNKLSECETDFAHSIVFKLVTSALNFYLPSALIVVLYFRIFRTIQRRTSTFPSSREHKTVQQTVSTSSESQTEKKKHKNTKSNGSNTRQTTKTQGRNRELCVETQMYKTLTVVGPAETERSAASSYQGVTVHVEYLNDRSHHMHHRACYPPEPRPTPCSSNCLGTGKKSVIRCSTPNKSKRNLSPTFNSHILTGSTPSNTSNFSTNSTVSNGKKSGNLNLIKERKAARQLGVIMGVFLACWVPYFTIFPVIAFCNSCVPSSAHMATISLGYLNSALNPAIYPLCNHHFRRAFVRMLRCRSLSSKNPVSTLPPLH